MRVIVVGGVFGRDEAYRRSINPTPEMTLVAGLRERGVDVVESPHSWMHRPGRADVVHVHHLAKSVPGLALASPLVARALVFTRHGQEAGLSTARATSLRLMHQRADAVVALSEQEAVRLRRTVRGRVVVIRNGIDSPPSAARRVSPPDGSPLRLLYVGQLIPLKNVEILLRAMAAATSTAEFSLRLVFHNDHLLEPLRSLAGRLGIAHAVTFVGSRDAAGMAEEYRQADALVLPSSTEALPSVVTEALLARIPVVASAVGGIPEQVEHAGLLVPPGDVAALESALTRLAVDYPSLAAAAQDRSVDVSEEYSIKKMIDRHLELYRVLLEHAGPLPDAERMSKP